MCADGSAPWHRRWHLHWTPWSLIGRHASVRTLCMHKVRAVIRRSHGNLNERRENTVSSQQQRRNSAVRSPKAPRGRRVHVVGTHMIATRTPLQAVTFAHRAHKVHGDHNATLPRLQRISFIPLRPHGDHTESPRRSLRSHSPPTELFGVCRALTQRSQCVVNYHLQKGMSYKSLLWKYSTTSKFPTLI